MKRSGERGNALRKHVARLINTRQMLIDMKLINTQLIDSQRIDAKARARDQAVIDNALLCDTTLAADRLAMGMRNEAALA